MYNFFMRNIIYYLLDIESHTNVFSYYSQMHNKSIINKKGDFWFKSSIWQKDIRINFGYNIISCNESLKKTSEKVLQEAFKEAI